METKNKSKHLYSESKETAETYWMHNMEGGLSEFDTYRSYRKQKRHREATGYLPEESV